MRREINFFVSCEPDDFLRKASVLPERPSDAAAFSIAISRTLLASFEAEEAEEAPDAFWRAFEEAAGEE